MTDTLSGATERGTRAQLIPGVVVVDMTVVKGTKPRHWRVVEYRPRRLWFAGLAVVALILVVGQVAFWVGYKQGMAGQELAIQDLQAVRKELNSARTESLRLRQEYENVRIGAEVDKKSLEEIRAEVVDLRTTIAELEEENQFYRNLMAPSGEKKGLNFGSVELSETDQDRHFRYKIVMQQLATNHDVLNGTLSVNIIGQRDGEVVVLPLNELSADVSSANIKLRFKYFQNIEGELILPVNFDPERVELEARSTGRNAKTIEKRFGWLVRERD